MRLRGILGLVVVVGAMAPAPSFAQTTPPAGENGARRWEMEAYGGLSLGRFTRGGNPALPGPGDPITTSSPIFPSWSVPSWFVGDGAAYLNNVAAEFGITNRLIPVDALLRPLGLNDAGHVLAGVRLRRPLAAPYTLELGFEVSAQSLEVSGDVLAGLASTAASFQSTFTELLSTGPFVTPQVTTAVAAVGGTARELMFTAALNAPMRTFGAFDTYFTAGGGVVLPAGDATASTITGRYRFQIAGAGPAVTIDESDTLTIRYRQRRALVGLVGGGVRRAVTDRWGLRIDARLLIGPETTTVRLDSAPSIATATPAGYLESFTYPNLQFSNNASTGRRSTLGAPGLDDADVFSGGWLLRGRVTVGFDVRF